MSEPKEQAETPKAPETPTAPELGENNLVMDGIAACDLLSDHGGEIVIMDDGRIVFMNAAAHLVELAHALEPENEDIRARWERVQATRSAVEGAAAEGTDPFNADSPGTDAPSAG